EPPLSALTSTSTTPCTGGYAACQKRFGGLSCAAMAYPNSQPSGSGYTPGSASGPSNADLPRVLSSAPANLPVDIRLSFARYLFGARRGEAILTIVMEAFLIGVGAWMISEPDETVHTARYGDVDGHVGGWLAVAVGVVLFAVLLGSSRRRI